MNQHDCCRLCLRKTSLNPIFYLPEVKQKYTDLLLNITGMQIQYKDSLPQLICTECVNFINQYIQFRKISQKTHKTLMNRLTYKSDNYVEVDNLSKTNDKYNLVDDCNRNDNYNVNDDCNVKHPKTFPSSNIKRKLSDDFDNLPSPKTYIHNNTVTCKMESLEGVNNDSCDDKLIMDTEYGTKFKEFETSVEKILKSGMEIVFTNVRPKKQVLLNYHISGEDKDDEVVEEVLKTDFECKYCSKILKSKNSLYSHYRIHTAIHIICEHCGKKFLTKRKLLMHCKAKHGYEKTDKCSVCDYRGSNAELVKLHERTHTGIKPYECECGAKFHRRGCYLQHLPIHLTEKTVQCDECPSMFKSVTLMQIHKARHRMRRKNILDNARRNTR